MFTGIITDVGEVVAVEADGDTLFRLRTSYPTADIALGASIACSGVCLTVIATGSDWFDITASSETLARTTMAGWRPGTRVNLERALRLGDELGGHLVSGHVDGTGEVASIAADGASRRFVFRIPDPLAPFIAGKGSVAIDGISLTVNAVSGSEFAVNIIPHTLVATTLGEATAGTRVNVEVDMLARYVARLLAADPPASVGAASGGMVAGGKVGGR
ncbi:MAG: riboflavin synthase [Rhodospirillales bacterium]